MVGCHSSRSNDPSVHARIDSTGYVRLLVESSEEDDKISHAAIFEVKFVKKGEGAVTASRERKADALFNDLYHFVPTAKCIIQDTTGRQLATRSGLQRLRCSVCHLHHEQAMKSPLRVRQFFSKCATPRSMSLLEMPMRQHTNTSKKHQYQDLYNSSVAVMLRQMQREFNTGRPFESRRHIDYFTKNHFSQLSSASDLDLLLHGSSVTVKTTWTQNHERILEQLACANTRQTRTDEVRTALAPKVSLGDGDGQKGLSRPRERRQSHDAPQDYDVRQSERVLEFQNRYLWLRPTDRSWHFPSLVSIREMPFRNCRARSPAKLKVRERTRSTNPRNRRFRKKVMKKETPPDGSIHPGPGLLHPHLLPGKNGAQTRHVSVLIGSQLIGTAQTKCVRLRHGSHNSHGNEIRFIEPHKGIHDDENNVCV